MKDGQGYKKCDSEDLNPFAKCEPENCELKYFGKRNFFNKNSNRCETVPKCGSEKKQVKLEYFNFN